MAFFKLQVGRSSFGGVWFHACHVGSGMTPPSTENWAD